MPQEKFNPAELSVEDQISIARMIIALLDDWGIDNADKINLLGLPTDTKPRALNRYVDNTPLPLDAEIYERIEHFVGIAEALRLANPLNPNEPAMWIKRRHRRFNQRSPLTIMLEDGLRGIVTVRTHIDCSYDWFIDEQQAR